MYIQPLGLNEACDNKKGKCARGLNCIAGFCLNQAIPATTPAVTTPAFTTPAITTPVPVTWKNYPGSLIRVAVGPKGVWGVNRVHEIFKKTAKAWVTVGGHLKDISVGKDSVWGVNKNDDIYMRTGAGGWQHIPGKLMQVSVSGFDDSVVWGVNSGNNIYRRKGNTWDKVGGALIVVSCGEAGVWGVNRNNDIYYRTGTYGGAVSAGTGWEKVGGGLSWISSGAAGEVWGVNKEDKIFRRDGVTEGNPTGTGWSIVGQSNGRLTQVDVFGGTAWGVNSDRKIWIWKSDSGKLSSEDDETMVFGPPIIIPAINYNDMIDSFETFIKVFEKKYSLEDELKRKKTFLMNKEKVEAHNDLYESGEEEFMLSLN
eukprot:GFUD01004610.1.p2 GENE.GFUD01004610.1~~GFUD01004610.1.p2  ORF type:complete len:369 (+),score=92.64 GFUD01004610.1:187-1293(+)